MNDIVAIKFLDKKYGDGAAITWGNVFEEKELLKVVECGLQDTFEVSEIISIKICDSLEEIADQPYFYECLMRFIQQSVPTKEKKYSKWLNKKKKSMKCGYDIYFNGFKARYYNYLERKAKGFPEDDESYLF